MPVLFPALTPTVGMPTDAIARRKPRKLPRYTRYISQENVLPQQQPLQESAPPSQPVQQQEQQPVTGDYLASQLERFRTKSNPTILQPSARVTKPNPDLINPVNFQAYYEQMNTIGDIGQQALAAQQARSAYQRMQSLQGIMSGGPPSPNPMSLGSAGGSIPSNPKANFRYAQQYAPQFGWNSREQAAWYALGMKESGWRNTAQNPTSTAYGIGQFLNSTWAGVGGRKTSDPRLQVYYMAKYIRNRYGSPSKALAFHLRNNWY